MASGLNRGFSYQSKRRSISLDEFTRCDYGIGLSAVSIFSEVTHHEEAHNASRK
jgi:hypothetical protein